MKKILLCFVGMISLSSITCSAEIEKPTISTAGNYCFAIKNDGSLWRWSYNGNDLSSYEDISDTEQIKIADNVATSFGTKYITENGELYSINETNGNIQADLLCENTVRIADSHEGYVLKKDSSLWKIEDYIDGRPILTKVMRNVKDVSDGHYHTMILKTDGTVWTRGLNFSGQLGSGEVSDDYSYVKVMDNVKYINAGFLVSFAETDDDILWRWGNNYGDYSDMGEYNIVSPEYYTDNVKQVFPKVGYNLILKNNGELWIYGDSENAKNGNVETIWEDRDYPMLSEINGLPKKIMDNVAEISEDMNGSISGPSLILTDGGELFLIDMFNNGGDAEICTYKLTEDVRLPEVDNENITLPVFIDISSSDETSYAVDHLLRAGIVDGVTENEFMPEKDITRAEAAAIILRMTGKVEEKSAPVFKDVSKEKWYYDIAGTSHKYDFISGFDDGTFRGDIKLSYAEAVSLAARALRSEGTAVEPEEYSDTDFSNVPEWAKEDIKYAVDHGIITEEELGRISDDRISRGDAACIFYKLYELM